MTACLWPTKASEGSVAGNVGLAAVAHNPHIGDLVRCVNVQQRAVHDGGAKVQPIATVVVQLAVQRLYLAIFVESNLQAACFVWFNVS